MRSLRARLMTGFVIGTVALLVGSGWSIHQMIRAQETDELDANLLESAKQISLLVEQYGDEVRFEWEHYQSDRPDQEPEEGQGVDPFVIYDQTAKVFASNADHAGLLPPLAAKPGEPPIFKDIALPGLGHCRVVGFWFQALASEHADMSGPRQNFFLAAARPTVEIDELLSRVDRAVLYAGIPILLLGNVGILLLLWHGFRGLVPLRRQLSNLAQGDLTKQVDPGPLTSEFDPLINSLNTMAQGLNDRIEREKRFVTAAAHELRTPIATILTNLELATAGSADASFDSPLTRSLEVTRYMKHVVERLLWLTRLERDVFEVETTTVELDKLVEAAVEPYAEKLNARGVVVDCELGSATTVCTDPVIASMILNNLFSNVLAYSPPNSVVYVQMSESHEGATVLIRNPTDPEATPDLARLAEPFWRGDRVRNLRDQHAGLGLAIATAAASRIDARLTFDLNDQQEFVASLCIPFEGRSAAQG